MKFGIRRSLLNKVMLISGVLILFSLITAFILFVGPFGNVLNLTENYFKKGSTNINPANEYDKKITSNQKKVDVLHYDLYFDLYPTKREFIAITTITGLIIDETISSIDFNFYENFHINQLTLNGNKVEYDQSNNILYIKPELTDLKDTFQVKIEYSGRPKKVGLSGFVFGKINGTSLIYTISEPDYASSWFPCKDFPEDKTLMDMKIRNDSSNISVSNGKLVSITNYSDKKIYHWKTQYPISTYLIALYSANYIHFSDSYVSLNQRDTMAIEYYVLPEKYENAKIDFAEHPDMIRFFSETFGEYPFINEKYGVAEFLWRSGAMENQTITGVAPDLIDGTNFYLDYYIHELAHHWWGDAISPKYWKDIWLNEGFSTYCEALYYEFRSGKSALQSTMLSKKQDRFTGKLSEPGAYLFSNTVYDKGGWVLHMLRKEVGKLTFFKILREYYNKYKYSNASTEDFIHICEKVSGLDLSKFFDQWLNGEGIIELEYGWETQYENKIYSTSLFIQQKQKGYTEYHFPLDIKIEFENRDSEYYKFNVSSVKSSFILTSNKKPVNIILDPNNWLLMTSHYKGEY